MGVAASAKSAKVRPDSQWLTLGDYLLQVTELKEIDKPGKLMFIGGFDILRGDGEAALKAGFPGAFNVDCLKFEGSLAGDVMKFISALTKTPVEEIDEDGINALLTTDQPATGMLVRCSAYPYTTSNKVTITKYIFTPATGEDVEEAPKLREVLGMQPLAVIAV